MSDYLKTPEHFRQLVQAKVEEELREAQLNEVQKKESVTMRKPKFRFTKAAAVAAIAVLAVGTTAVAAWQSRLSTINPSLSGNLVETIAPADITSEQALPAILERFEVTGGDGDFSEALVTISEAYYDGMYLYLYGKATEVGKNYDLHTSRVVINDRAYIGEFQKIEGTYLEGKVDTEKGEYYGKFTLDGEAGNHFTVELPLSIYNDTQNPKLLSHQTLSFDVAQEGSVIDGTDQTIEVSDNITLNVSNIKKTLVGTRMNLTWTIATDDADDILSQWYDYRVVDNTGATYESTMFDGPAQIEVDYQATIDDIERQRVIENEDGTIEIHNKILIPVEQTAESVTLTLLKNGQPIEGMEAEVSLK